MFLIPAEKSSSLRQAAMSAAVHGAVLLALLIPGREVRVRASLPGSPKGSRIELSYLPGGSPASVKMTGQTRKATTVTKEAKLVLPKRPAPPAAAPAESPSPSPASSSDASNNALGNEDIRIALTTYSPSPKPDLSQMPRGAQGEVILDVTIDPTGQVADLQILQTLGYGVDGAVAATVKTWKFSPATKDGVPVASVQELHFHYGPV